MTAIRDRIAQALDDAMSEGWTNTDTLARAVIEAIGLREKRRRGDLRHFGNQNPTPPRRRWVTAWEDVK